jgi:integrator complex subunit 1
LKELVKASDDKNLPILMKHVIFNEMSNSNNPNNLLIFNVLFDYNQIPSTVPTTTVSNDLAAASLATGFVEVLLQKGPTLYLKPLRALLRKIMSSLRNDTTLNIYEFSFHLMNNKAFDGNQFRRSECQEILSSIIDLINLSMFLCVTANVRDSMNSYIRGDNKHNLELYKNFLIQVSKIQRDGVVWMYGKVMPSYTHDNVALYPLALHKLLFIASPEEYWKVDGWPSENERNMLFKAVTDIPLLEDTLVHLFAIGMSKTHPINGRDTIDLVEYLIKRASTLYQLVDDKFSVLGIEKVENVMELLFQLAAYSYPDSITLPSDYSPPSMAISTVYWKAWLILVILCAHNPIEFGNAAWENYPTLKACMEMCITNQFKHFPPQTFALPGSDKSIEYKTMEIQISTLERRSILDFESQLAAATSNATITESNSLLLSQLITMQPRGPLRKPTQDFLDMLKNANQNFRIGHLLCKSREPDFLLDILQR